MLINLKQKKAAEVKIAQKRFEEQMRAKDSAGAALVAEQLKFGFTLKDHPSSQFNGVYHKVSEYNGWPVMQNGSADAFCYHYNGGDKRNKARWQFSRTNTPQVLPRHSCSAHPLPCVELSSLVDTSVLADPAERQLSHVHAGSG